MMYYIQRYGFYWNGDKFTPTLSGVKFYKSAEEAKQDFEQKTDRSVKWDVFSTSDSMAHLMQLKENRMG